MLSVRTLFFLAALAGLVGCQSPSAPTSSGSTAPTTYTVSFSANGGTGTMATQSGTSGTTVVLTANSFTDTGYTFSGWNTAKDGSGTGYSDQASLVLGSSNVTLYAMWIGNVGAIGFNANGGTGTMTNQSLSTGKTAPLTAVAFTRAGYTFQNWNTKQDGTGTTYADQASYTMGPTSVTLYAQWLANSNTIVFNSNGGTGTMSTQTVKTGQTATLSTNTFVNSGLTFMGWATTSTGTVAYADQASYTMGTSATVNLYAVWAVGGVVSYNINGQSGTAPASAAYAQGSTVTVSSTNLLGSYQLAGWMTKQDGTGTSYALGASFTMGSSNVTLYAIWIPTNLFAFSSGTTISVEASSSLPPTGSLTIPAGVTAIQSSGFYNCTGLTSVTLPVSVVTLGSSAFSSCTKITSVSGATNLTTIGANAFNDCSSLTAFTVPATVTSIGDGAFWGCKALTSFTIPAAVTSVGNDVFGACTGLTSISVSSSNTAYKSESGVLVTAAGVLLGYPAGLQGAYTVPSDITAINTNAFDYATGLTSVTIPSGVTSIGDDAFWYCSQLTTVTIPASVTSIGNYAFSGTSNSLSVTMLSSTPPTLGSSAFPSASTSSIKIHVPSAAAVTAYSSATNWTSYVGAITTP